MTPMQARLVGAQLDDVDQNSTARLSIAKIYHEGLKDIPGIRLPPLREDGSHIYLSYAVQVPDRLDLVKYLMRYGRDCVIQHIRNTADLDCFSEFARECPNARRTANEVLLLPTYPGYRRSQAEKT